MLTLCIIICKRGNMLDKMEYENIIHVLVDYANSSNKTADKNLAKNILSNFELIPKLSIEKLALLCYVSQPTLTRFIKKLGYNNYHEFRTYASSVNNIIGNESATDLFAVDMTNPIEDHYSTLSRSLTATCAQLEKYNLKKITEKINNAHKLVIIGIDYSQLTAMDAQLRFSRYGKLFETGVTATEQCKLVKGLKKGDLLIVLSVSGITKALSSVTTKLDPNVDCILITSNNEPLILSDHKNIDVINISSEADQKTNTSQCGRMNLLFAIDILYITYGQLYHNK